MSNRLIRDTVIDHSVPARDNFDSYFECISECSWVGGEDVECVTRCVEIHLKNEEEA